MALLNLTVALGVAQDVFGITYKLRTVVFAADYAVKEINSDASLLAGYHLQLLPKETACSEAVGLQAVALQRLLQEPKLALDHDEPEALAFISSARLVEGHSTRAPPDDVSRAHARAA